MKGNLEKDTVEMKLNELLNMQVTVREKRTVREKALRGLAGFFALMVLCTVLSRITDTLTIAVVEVKEPTRSTINHTIRMQGRLRPAEETAVVTISDVLVQSVKTRKGASVKAGDVLFTLDVNDLQQRLEQEQLELQKLNATLAQAKKEQSLNAEKRELSLYRAQENYDFAVTRNRNKLLQAGEERRYARDELRAYRSNNDIDEDKPDDEQDTEYLALKKAYKSAQRAYEDAQNLQLEEMRDAERALEDAQLESLDTQVQTMEIDRTLKQMSISRIQAPLAQEGQVVAPLDGVITEVLVTVGKKTSGESAVLLAEKAAGQQFIAEITEEQARFVTRGDIMKLSSFNAQKEIEAKVESVAASVEKSGMVEVAAYIPEGADAAGMQAEAEIIKRSDSYATCVPLAALHSDGTKKYLLIVRESETALGRELIAERVDVIVQDSNETMAAVSGALDSKARVIISSNKMIGAGDRVRLQAS